MITIYLYLYRINLFEIKKIFYLNYKSICKFLTKLKEIFAFPFSIISDHSGYSGIKLKHWFCDFRIFEKAEEIFYHKLWEHHTLL